MREKESKKEEEEESHREMMFVYICLFLNESEVGHRDDLIKTQLPSYNEFLAGTLSFSKSSALWHKTSLCPGGR